MPDLFDIVDAKGRPVEYEILDYQDTSIVCENRTESPAAGMPVRRHRVLLAVDLPQMGYQSFGIRKRRPRYVPHPAPGPERKHVAQPGGILENRFLKVQINPNGATKVVITY